MATYLGYVVFETHPLTRPFTEAVKKVSRGMLRGIYPLKWIGTSGATYTARSVVFPRVYSAEGGAKFPLLTLGSPSVPLFWEALITFNIGITEMYADPNITTSIPHSHCYWVVDPPKPQRTVVSAFLSKSSLHSPINP